jgi:hypothetical protein
MGTEKTTSSMHKDITREAARMNGGIDSVDNGIILRMPKMSGSKWIRAKGWHSASTGGHREGLSLLFCPKTSKTKRFGFIVIIVGCNMDDRRHLTTADSCHSVIKSVNGHGACSPGDIGLWVTTDVVTVTIHHSDGRYIYC